MAHVGDRQCTVYRNVDHGIYVRRQERHPDHYYEMREPVQFFLRILELEKDCEEGTDRGQVRLLFCTPAGPDSVHRTPQEQGDIWETMFQNTK